MSELASHFKIDVSRGKSKPNYVFQGKTYRITVLSDVLLRLEYNPDGIFNDYPTILALNRNFEKDPNIIVKQDEKYLNITNDYFVLEYSKEKPFEASKLVPDSNLRITVKDTDKIWYFNNPEVRNYKGSTYSFDYSKSFTLDKGLYNIDGFASIDDTARPVFIEDGSIKKNPSNGTDIYLFLYKNDFKKALDSYFELTGKPALLPRYALGVIWNKNEKYTSESLEELTDNFKKNELPLSSVILSNYKDEAQGKVHANFAIGTDKFSNAALSIGDLHNKDIYLGLSIKSLEGLTPSDNNYNYYKQLLGLNKDSIIPINVYNTKLLDLFYKTTVMDFERLGVDYLLLDDITEDKIFSFMLMHYTFMNYLKSDARRGFILSRNPGIASHRYPALYSGQTDVSWKTLRYLPFYNLTSSNIGLSWWSHDIGGYKNGTEDAELFTRYVEFGVYSPIFRLASKEGKYYKREPWAWDVKTKKIVRDYVRLRHKLIPYIYSEAYKYYKDGEVLTKPLYYSYPEVYDEPLYKNEYYFGSQLFVSPITESKDAVMNRVLKRIYLPEGMWYDFKTGKKFPGGKRYASFYKDEDYPVFAKSGAIIPMAVLDENDLNNTKPPKHLEIQVFPGESNNYNLYEDDGLSNLYKQGYYIVTNIDYNYRANNYTLIIRPVEGKLGIIPEKRDYKVRFRNTKEAENVKVYIGREEVPCTYEEEENDFVIEIKDVPTNSQLTVNCFGKAIEIDAVRLINEDIDGIISDLQIETNLKEKVASVIFSDKEIRRKRIEIRKLKRKGLNPLFVKMFIKLLEYISEL